MNIYADKTRNINTSNRMHEFRSINSSGDYGLCIPYTLLATCRCTLTQAARYLKNTATHAYVVLPV